MAPAFGVGGSGNGAQRLRQNKISHQISSSYFWIQDLDYCPWNRVTPFFQTMYLQIWQALSTDCSFYLPRWWSVVCNVSTFQKKSRLLCNRFWSLDLLEAIQGITLSQHFVYHLLKLKSISSSYSFRQV